MEKKFGAATIILIILLIIRFIGQFANAFLLSADMVYLVISSILGVVYLAALIGVLIKQKWGSILVMIIAVIDILFALPIGGAKGFGAGVMDLILIFLGYKEYKQISS
jgi:ABC-type multidrug transport system permease subunit